MKLPSALTSLIKKKEDGKEYYFSLYMDVDAAAVAVWSMDPAKLPTIASFAHGVVKENTWEARIQVIDRLLSAAEDKVGVTKAITKTVFGMPGAYLTAEGNIADEIRPQLKKLAQVLELKPVGFVPLSQALAFSLKNDEGVPPSIILIGCSQKNALITLFRVGKLTSQDTVDLADDPAAVVEAILKKNQDGDVLPSRMLLYGGDTVRLEDVRTKLLKHPWPTRTNFLHFPKIEIVSVESLLHAVSLAGAAELASDIGEPIEAAGTVATVVAQPRPSILPSEPVITPADTTSEKEEVEEEAVDEREESGIASAGEEEGEPGSLESEAETVGDAIEKEESSDEEVSNVELVTPESLGFRKEDILEKTPASHMPRPVVAKPINREELEEDVFEEEDEEEVEDTNAKKPFKLPFSIPTVRADMFAPVTRFLSHLRFPKMKNTMYIFGAVGVVLLLGVLFYFVPRVTVTVLVSPQSVDQSTTLTVNPTATVADPASKIIPGHTQSKSISGDKTIAVTGKKNVGDPSKGTVTIYNKVTNSKTLPKGTVLTGNSLSFTLDSDVSIASASEDIGSITFGKATANVTAKDIGPNGNLPAGVEFVFTGVSGSQASARNDAAFTGGNSKSVTVISRADQDGLVKALTDDLVGQAKSQLAASATGGEHLIDETVKTAVSDKSFDQEIDQQASQLHGKITITVSGISISDEDVKAILTSLVEGKVPAGYALAPDQTNVSVSNVTVKKDGSITLTAKLTAIALPKVDTEALKTTLAGKDVTAALTILKQTTGVAGAEYKFAFSPVQSRLPMNRNNITITTAVQR